MSMKRKLTPVEVANKLKCEYTEADCNNFVCWRTEQNLYVCRKHKDFITTKDNITPIKNFTNAMEV